MAFSISTGTVLGMQEAGGSSVRIVTLDWTTGIRSLAGAKAFSSNLCEQTGYKTH